ncbi:phosphatase PAP2 family protein [Deinococcus cellulosilyticus]|uniref:Phosphatidylglycerophosphatase B n=1 Tax=Deinococcus cellulosilyticus (strain DSM 18568 / NBRC 106333 / KACC 11606 / 5516J-15) TaxID=1223518 RepID=A0A511N935_DEIC1|nr:phosphatase PAP2 family protein [Deinococcus cellulosilyticus]GEM49342.1 phosphatidylglycerophosphatase B [Deinococcus cellulosilyticus NBRC 106333 = KACC 11606]
MLNWISQALKLHWKTLIFWLLGILLPLLAVGAIAEDLLDKEPFTFEEPFMRWLHSHSTPFLDALAITLGVVGSIKIIGPISVLICIFALRHRRAYGIYFLLATLGAGLLNVITKLIFDRERPNLWEKLVNEPAASFPSGHSMYSAALAASLIALLWHTRYRSSMLIVGVLFALSVGISRIYLGVHYPTDVVSGWAAGMAWALALWKVLRSRKRTNPEGAVQPAAVQSTSGQSQ